jgi:hypothetical protein
MMSTNTTLCPVCYGKRRVQYYDGHSTQMVQCETCKGNGRVDSDEDAPKLSEGVGCSEWVAPLEAALRDASAAKAEAAKPWNGNAFYKAWEDERCLERAIEIMRSRGATVGTERA